ncbi:MAG: tyrosine-type recombinase/integrase [Lachnospiraceae bacterium]|nr:tyrosine-type recombinase/integrase [Lachnospiraceae bacterium]
MELIHALEVCDKMYEVGATNDEIMKVKKKAILEKHHHKITYIEKKNYWQTLIDSEGHRITAKTEEALFEKLARYYCSEYTFDSVFELALQEKIETENPKELTVMDYRSTYRLSVFDSLKEMTLKEITPIILKKFLMDYSLQHPKKKQFLKVKGILNIVFEYATDPEHHLVTENPVPKNNRPYAKNFAPSSRKAEDKAFSENEVMKLQEYLLKKIHAKEYDIYAYAILFSSFTGLRVGEIPALKWEDLKGNALHVHAQQSLTQENGHYGFFYEGCTKNEKGVSNDGRFVPLSSQVVSLLSEIREKQNKLGICSEWIFSKEDGTWIDKRYYDHRLRAVSKDLGLSLTNNHALRMAFNSYVLTTMGIEAPDRAKILGHTVETNLQCYTFSHQDDFLSEMTEKLDNFYGVACRSHNILSFSAKRETRKVATLRASK